MSRLSLFAILAALLILVVSVPTTGAQSDRPAETGNADSSPPIADATADIPDPSEGLQSPADALAEDMALEAQSKGWTVDQVAAHRERSDMAGRVAAEIREQRPDIFVGLALSPEPAGPAELYIKGPADELVHALVDRASVEIKLVDNQPFSQKELDALVSQTTDALAALGYRDSAVWYDLSGGGKIEAEIARQAGLPGDPAEISSALPPDIGDTVTVTVSDSAVGVTEDAFGGMSLPLGDVETWCTSGWSVGNGVGTTGVTTAGHCGNLPWINDPATGLIPLMFQAAHRGQWGDIEWLTSNQLEPAKFYSDQNTIRYVTALKPVGDIHVDDTVCLYGRASNNRRCARVEATNVSCLGVQRLVRVNADISIGGDSGAGWSWGNTAIGSHVGDCGGRNVFSVADYFDEALGVTVRLAQTLPTNGLLWPSATSDDRLTSADGRFVAAMQTDGNFVIYRTQPWTALWASSQCRQTSFADIHAVMQSDGNFVLYPSAGSPARWATSWAQTQPACISNQQTVFGSGVYMVMQNDGNLVMYKPGYGAVWASNTCCY